MRKPRICLNMIVKNEAHVIRRCLASARPLIDAWCIVDTGSSDGTQALVREALAGTPGALHERPWKDFGHNRSEALELARAQQCDYLLFIDADEYFTHPDGFTWPELTADAYDISRSYGGMVYRRTGLVTTRLPWRWEGVLHEYLTCGHGHGHGRLDQPRIVQLHEGARSRDPTTYLKDIAVLEAALLKDPGNTRYTFYLAQSCRDAGRLQQAHDLYLRRAGMGGWDQEVWSALYQAARMLELAQGDPAEVAAGYLAAYQSRPTRAEPLVNLARFHRLRKEYAVACLYAQQAAAMSQPDDSLFVEHAVYRWQALDELAVSAYYMPAYREAGRAAMQRLLQRMDEIPTTAHARMRANARFYDLAGGATPQNAAPHPLPATGGAAVLARHSAR